MKKIRHSKFKNTGILFELLVRQITLEILNGDKEVAKNIVKEFFKQGTELSKEKKLYDLLLKEKYKMSEVYYIGEHDCDRYNRFMIIGKK